MTTTRIPRRPSSWQSPKSADPGLREIRAEAGKTTSKLSRQYCFSRARPGFTSQAGFHEQAGRTGIPPPPSYICGEESLRWGASETIHPGPPGKGEFWQTVLGVWAGLKPGRSRGLSITSGSPAPPDKSLPPARCFAGLRGRHRWALYPARWLEENPRKELDVRGSR